MKTKLYKKALKLYCKWTYPMMFPTKFWMPIWDDFWFWFTRMFVSSFAKDAVMEFNYGSQILANCTDEVFETLKRDYMLNSWQKFLEEHKRHRKRYWDAEAVLKRAVSGEGDLER